MQSFTILFVSSDPSNETRLRISQEYRDIQEEIQRSPDRINFTFRSCLSARHGDISRSLLQEQPTLVHFSGHGGEDGSLCFEDEQGHSKSVSPEALANLFRQFADRINCVLLNACYSKILAEKINQYIPYVIGMEQAINDSDAITFAIGFYKALGSGTSIEKAFEIGRADMGLSGSQNSHLPKLLINHELASNCQEASLTYSEMKEKRLIELLANLYEDAQRARRLLERIGFAPGQVIFPVNLTPMDFWDWACQQIDKGLLPDGSFERLLREAAKDFPGNPKLQAYREN